MHPITILLVKDYRKTEFIERNNVFVKIKCQKYDADNEEKWKIRML